MGHFNFFPKKNERCNFEKPANPCVRKGRNPKNDNKKNFKNKFFEFFFLIGFLIFITYSNFRKIRSEIFEDFILNPLCPLYYNDSQ